MMLLLLAALAAAQSPESERTANEPALVPTLPGSSQPSYLPQAEADPALDAALMAARASGKHVLVVFGGEWCHDSAAFASALSTTRARAMLASRYETVWVDVPYSLDARAIPVAHRLGLGDITGTPTVLILRPDGTPTNLLDAPGWRNAASRKPAAIVRELERAAPARPAR